MANPVVSVKIVTDSTAAVTGTNDATAALKKFEDQAGTASTKTRDMSGGIESIGDTAGKATTGLRDMSDAVAMAGFPQFAAGMQVAAVGLESLDGAATLFKATQEGLTKITNQLKNATIVQTVATKAQAAATKVVTVATKAFNAVMKLLKITILTNPIFIIAAILIAIGIAFVMLYKKCEGFRKVVDKVFKFVWNLIKAVFNWFKGIVRTVIDFVIGYFQLIWKVWKKVFTTVVSIVRGAIDIVKGVIRSIVDTISNIVQKVKDTFAKVYDWIKEPFEKAINWVKDHLKLPKIDLPFIGKGGKTTLVAPGVARAPGVHASAGGVTINITGAVDPAATARQVRRLLRSDSYRVGLVAR